MTTTNHFLRKLFISGLMLALSVSGFSQSSGMDDNFRFAKQHQDDLTLSVYITAHSVERLLSTPEGRREATSLMMANGITKVYLEVYRGGLVVAPSLLTKTTTYFTQNGFEVVGGIATVPGGDIGVKQEGELGWFNWQNPKTQQDMKKVMLDAAPIFDTFIVDDFLCTGDISLESKAAKGDSSWSDYRRQLMTELASSLFIDPAKSVNQDIHMIIKYPQWYDRFHMFGYDVETGPKLFDEVWVGTETRGQYTQRFGFVQPYEGFVNYSWIKSMAGKKIGGAWFDHGDCDALDFVEQAYQSVLAGANELVMFNYGSFVNGHAGHHLMRMDFEKLARLAKALKTSHIHGVAGYKPPHSDAGGDLYIMDFVGMFGIPLMPTVYYPENAATIFLPTQAAADPNIVGKVVASHKQGKRIIMTAGFLANVEDKGKLSKLAGILKPEVGVISAEKIILDGSETTLEMPLDLESTLEVKKAIALLEVKEGNDTIPFLTKSKDGQVYVLNSHTFSEADFKAVGEVLLCPRPLGLLDLPTSWANEIRAAFNEQLQIELNAPTRITMQPLENGDLILHNYNKEEVELQLNGLEGDRLLDAFTGQKLDAASGTLKMKPRSRLWIGNTH
ncbi:hypothetical protein H4O18_14720 [Arenibacter sp. BSSL-BM3]|uniref:Glycoside hydrolase family 42 N-terminal domain-containing protein n=1 Tax=Arenibacter arenosicollis TaxID=2762274 RepID=A0ABR7QQR4_9FLAO|nr:hypothetical protein [Arenibacter arenosicollis]MBC8769247.1 hypothetical protein [Arenibacter arenosicollis]